MFTHVIAMSVALMLQAGAASPADDKPAFSDPSLITNPWVAFEPGAVRVLNGRTEGERTTSVVTHLEQTRIFDNGGLPVECRILEEKDFVSGALVEIALNYLAQDDAGNVHAFGEVSFIVTDGVVTGAEQDSWLVGGPTQVGDPAGAYAATEPAMFMPATLTLGDEFDLEALPDATEPIVVVAVDVVVKVQAGKFKNAIKLMELDDGEDGNEPGPPEFRWVVPGVGVVKERTKGMKSELIATSQTAEETIPADP